MSTRRYADPVNVKRIWDSIRSSKQIQVDYIRIIKYIQNDEECSPTHAELYVKQCLKDKLILLCKGTGKLSDPQTTFRITNQELPDFDDIDWYCFECHRAGEVKRCEKCHRVYHPHCVLKARRRYDAYRKTNNYNLYKSKTKTAPETSINISSDSDEVFNIEEAAAGKPTDRVTSSADRQKQMTDKENYVYNEELCSVCNIKNVDTGCDLETTEMNYLLKFVLDRIRSWLPNTLTHTMAQEDRPDWLTDAELTWRANQLFFEHKDMSVIEVNLNNETYTLLAEFVADVYTVQHNVAIFHGLESQEYGASELMLRDTLHDLTELKNCADCYKHSNEKINQRWFCLPCRNPHDLVWAKQKGYPYWPAKILRECDKHFDVRFFGGKYERAMLMKNYVKPISVPKETLQIKASAAFTKSLEELEFHKLLLNSAEELEKFKASSKPTRKTLSKQRNSLLNVSPENLKKTGKKKQAQDDSFQETASSRLKGKKKRGRPFRTSREKASVSPEKRARTSNEAGEEGESSISGNIIDISDGDDDEEHSEYSFRESGFGNGPYLLEDGFEPVSSSTENFRNQEAVGSTNIENVMQRLDQPYCDAVEKMRRVLETLPDKKSIIKQAMSSMQLEMDKITNAHNDTLKRLFESHNNQISETKKKQWCYNCEQDAIYHCCWNTAYCSQLCQQQHWQAEHKKVCRRKRPDGKELVFV
ncbi:unnamed protein product [Brassicogethes aeneus]|uniref:Zinc finger MYND domain-containing protein 11 n=1 Tax=Brassicogethes aeneus TaxID=1431903 RepID=A0A9P0BB94_BRAAE|nr:unnamed protein product [Brassicogethes aeneus]